MGQPVMNKNSADIQQKSADKQLISIILLIFAYFITKIYGSPNHGH